MNVPAPTRVLTRCSPVRSDDEIALVAYPVLTRFKPGRSRSCCCLSRSLPILSSFSLRLYYPWPYNLHLLSGAWLIIAITLGIVVARAVFSGGRITYHRIIGAILLYLLIAMTFGTLFTFVGLSMPDAFKGIEFKDDLALASSVFYLSFVTLTSTGYGDMFRAPPGAKSLQYRKRHWPTLSGDHFG